MIRKIFTFILLYFACANIGFATQKDIVALVNDVPITAYELETRKALLITTHNVSFSNKQEELQFKQVVLNQLIEAILLKQHSAAMGVNINEENIDNMIRAMEKHNKMPEGGIESLLEEKGVSVESYRNQLAYELLKNNIWDMVSIETDISDSETLEFIVNNNKFEFDIDLFLFKIEKANQANYQKLQKIRQKLLSLNVEQIETYQPYGISGITRIKKVEQLPDVMQTVLHNTAAGQVSDIFKDDNSYNIMFVAKKDLRANKDDLSAVKEEIANARIARKVDVFLKRLRSNAHIVINP